MKPGTCAEIALSQRSAEAPNIRGESERKDGVAAEGVPRGGAGSILSEGNIRRITAATMEGAREGAPTRSDGNLGTDCGPITKGGVSATLKQQDGDTKTGIGSTGRPKSGTNTRSTTRRRTLIQAYSDDDAEENITPPTSRLPIFKGHTTSYHDVDIDIQLENVSPEHGGSSLQISASQEEYMAALNQATVSLDRLDTFNIVDATPPTYPHKSPRKELVTRTQSAKRRRSERGRHAHDSGASQPQHTREAMPSIDIVSKMWLGFSIHEAIATQKGNGIILEHRTNEEFEKLETPRMKSLTLTPLDEHSQESQKHVIQTRGRMRSPATTSTLHKFQDTRESTP